MCSLRATLHHRDMRIWSCLFFHKAPNGNPAEKPTETIQIPRLRMSSGKVKEVIPEMMGNYKYINPHGRSTDTENSTDATETVTSIIEP